MRVVLTPEDMKKGDLVDPGWYVAMFSDYVEEAAKTDGSTNCYLHFKIVDEGSAKGVTPRKLFNEKAMGFGKDLWPLLKMPFDKEKGFLLETDMFKQKVSENIKLKIHVKRGKSDKGNEFNDVDGFLPLTEAPK